LVRGDTPSAAAEWRKNWTLVSATTAGMSLAALPTFAFGVMLAPIEQEFGWTRAQISTGPAVVSFMGIILATAAGYAIDRLGARRVGIMVVLLSCVAITSMSTVGNSLWHWWAAWGLLGLAATATGTVWLAPLPTFFVAGRGVAIAVTLSGTAITAMLVPPLTEYFIQNHGWRSGFVGLAVIWGIVTIPLVFLFVPNPKKAQPHPTDGIQDDASPELHGLTGLEGFRSPALYLIVLASFASTVVGVALILNLVPVLSFTGLSRANAVMIAGLMGVAQLVGRLIGGMLMDRISAKWLAVFASFGALAFPLGLLLMPGSVWAAILAVIIYATTSSMKSGAIVYLTTGHLGTRSFGLFYGTISMTTAIAMGIGPMVANHVYDITGSYTPVLWASVPCFLAAALFFALLGPYPGLFNANHSPL